MAPGAFVFHAAGALHARPRPVAVGTAVCAIGGAAGADGAGEVTVGAGTTASASVTGAAAEAGFTESRNARKAGFSFATSASDPKSLKNQVAPANGAIATSMCC